MPSSSDNNKTTSMMSEGLHTSSLFRTFSATLEEKGLQDAVVQVCFKTLHVIIPLLEIFLFLLFIYVVYALSRGKELKRHSVLINKIISKEREHPRDIMKPHFFQNRQGLWIHHWLLWNEKKTPLKGIVVFFHGYAEHSRRFHHVAEYLNKNGYAAFGMDHQGFGRSEGDRGHVEDFMDYIEDALEFLERVVYNDHPEWKDLPRFVGGHSMGGLITIHTALRCKMSKHPGHKLSGVLLFGPALYIDPNTHTWYLRLIGNILKNIVPKAPIVTFPLHPSTSFLQVKFHANFDPLNYHGNVRIHQGLELLRGTKLALEMAPAFDYPVLIFHGVQDLHVQIDGSRKFMSLIASEDKTLEELEGIRHEPLQEETDIRESVLRKVTTWLDAHSS